MRHGRPSGKAGTALRTGSALLVRWETAALLLGMVIFVLLRARWIGHLLAWDEAMNLCTVRSFSTGGTDVFSNWFWRHPPLYCLLLRMLQPLREGFAPRAQAMTVALCALNAGLLYGLNRKVLGRRTALWATFFLAVLPSAVFFDVWVKRDHLAVTFSLMAFLLLLHRRSLYAGLCLGLALLSKETAVFSCLAAVLLWAVAPPRWRRVSDLAALTVAPVLTSAWWFLFVAPDRASASAFAPGAWQRWLLRETAAHLRFALGEEAGWAQPWDYYLRQLPHSLGIPGLILSAVGGAALCSAFVRKKTIAQTAGPFGDVPRGFSLWPTLLLAPAYLVLSAFPSKVPWIAIVLLPAWATLQGIGMAGLLDMFPLGRKTTCPCDAISYTRRVAACSVSAVVILWCVHAVRTRDYEEVFQEVAVGQWRGASHSHRTAELMNGLVKDGDRMLLTSFHYWRNLPAGHPCAVFSYYFRRDAEVLVRSHQRRFGQVCEDIRKYRLDWAVLSPEPGRAAKEIIEGFSGALGLPTYPLPRAVVFRTSSLYTKRQPSAGAE